MKTLLQTIGVVALVLIAILGLSWLVTGNEFYLYRYFGPKQEEVRRQVFEQTKSYNQGMVQELQNMQFEYLRSNTNAQQALASVILHRAADFPEDKLPQDLRTFINNLKNQPEAAH